MNLYRSFGNLLETWVAEGGPCSDPEQDKWFGSDSGNSLTASPDMGTNLRSESVDSGVEIASSDTSFPSPCSSVSVGNPEIDSVTTEREEDRLTPAPTSQPRDCSSDLHLKLEQALQRTDPKWQNQRNNPKSHTDDVVLRQKTRTSSLAKQHTPTVIKGQRSESFELRKTVRPLLPSRHMSEPRRRPLSHYCENPSAHTKTEAHGEEGREGLSPGLNYLEQVCQMLEEIARLQMRNRGLQMEMDTLRENQAKQMSQAPETLRCNCKASVEDLSSCQRLKIAGAERISSDTQMQNSFAYNDFRRRSASDTRIAAGHLRRLNLDTRGQQASVDNLLEQEEEDHEKQEITKEEKNKIKSWKLKIRSLRREESMFMSDSEINGQQMHSSKKKTTRRRLSQLFRRRKETLPE